MEGLTELEVLRIESLIAVVVSIVVCGYAAWFFFRVNRPFATYAALANVFDLAIAACLTYTAFDISGLSREWPNTWSSHALRAIPLLSSIATAGFLWGLSRKRPDLL